jgi:endonuclease YncB( thermonuclease family)
MLLADLADYTRPSNELDAEEVHHLMSRFSGTGGRRDRGVTSVVDGDTIEIQSQADPAALYRRRPRAARRVTRGASDGESRHTCVLKRAQP